MSRCFNDPSVTKQLIQLVSEPWQERGDQLDAWHPLAHGGYVTIREIGYSTPRAVRAPCHLSREGNFLGSEGKAKCLEPWRQFKGRQIQHRRHTCIIMPFFCLRQGIEPKSLRKTPAQNQTSLNPAHFPQFSWVVVWGGKPLGASAIQRKDYVRFWKGTNSPRVRLCRIAYSVSLILAVLLLQAKPGPPEGRYGCGCQNQWDPILVGRCTTQFGPF